MNSIPLYFISVLYVLGWLEFHIQTLILEPRSQTYGISVLIATVMLGVQVYKNRAEFSEKLQNFKSSLKENTWLLAPLFILFIIFTIGAYECRFPPHYSQEADVTHFHMSLPRLHLLLGSLSHLAWSPGDFWPMPISYGFAPAWFMQKHFNKIPQYLSQIWVLILFIKITREHWQVNKYSLIYLVPSLIFFGSHGVGLQIGSAMIDFAQLYFLLATFDSFFHKRHVWFALHLATFAASKPLTSLQILAVGLVLSIIRLLIKIIARSRLNLFKDADLKFLKKASLPTLLIFSILMLRPVFLSFKYLGTPLFGIKTCQMIETDFCNQHRDTILKSTNYIMNSGNQYGLGKSFTSLIKHIWLVAIPTISKVNNEYDYPLGLGWLVFVVLFFYQFFLYVKNKTKRISNFYLLSIAFWIVWWLSSQQSRWLYPVVIFGLLACRDAISLVNRRVFSFILSLSALATALSLASAYNADLKTTPENVQQNEITSLQNRINVKTNTLNASMPELLYVQDASVTPVSYYGWVFDLQDKNNLKSKH